MKWQNKGYFFLFFVIFLPQTSVISQQQNNEELAMGSIGIESGIAKQHADQLNQLLANEFVLYTKTLNFHWNVKGEHFGPLHTFFQDQYEQLEDIIDIVAEQIQMLGLQTAGSLKEFLSLKSISEDPIHVENDTAMLQILLALHEDIIKQLRSIIATISETNNYALENVLQEILAKHEKMHWMIQAHLE